MSHERDAIELLDRIYGRKADHQLLDAGMVEEWIDTEIMAFIRKHGPFRDQLDRESEPGAVGPQASSIFTCANERCRAPLGVDHVTLITTAHVRRFCSVECIAEGQRAHIDSVLRGSGLRDGR